MAIKFITINASTQNALFNNTILIINATNVHYIVINVNFRITS